MAELNWTTEKRKLSELIDWEKNPRQLSKHDAGAILYNSAILINRTGTVAMQVAHNFPIGRKLGKTHQNVLVFYKGDPKAIKEWGDVEVGDLE